jgi:hypothetical protein
MIRASPMEAVRDHDVCRVMRRGFVATNAARRSTSTHGITEPSGELERRRQQRVDHESDHDGDCRREPVLAGCDTTAGQFQIQVL